MGETKVASNQPGSARVIIAEDEGIARLNLKEMLISLGYQVVGEAADAPTAVELARRLHPDLAVLDIKMSEGMDGIDAASVLTGEGIAPVLLLTAHSEADLIERAKAAGVAGYVVKPYTQSDLVPAIEIALSQYHEIEALKAENSTLKELLETRKRVEKAKGILMDIHKLTESEAFKRIQRLSMNSRKSMREVADAILLAYEAGKA